MRLYKKRKNAASYKVLAPLEFLYSLGFSAVIFFKKRFGFFDAKPFTVVSVGNLSVGGTGKSVFVLYLAKLFPSSAVLLRGYRRRNKKEKNILVHRGASGIDVDSIGDEAMMYVYNGVSPVVVGANRQRSVALLQKFCAHEQEHFRYVFLDDAYQNFQLKKDFEILLLDARAPFDNGHCLPRGRLREKDASRADVIVLTHADAVSRDDIVSLQKKFFPTRVFCGRHAAVGFFNAAGERVDLAGSKVFAFAGIGSFSGFLETLAALGVTVVGQKKFRDHTSYDQADIARCREEMMRSGGSVMVTTEKDWQKLRGIGVTQLYVLKIEFAFLDAGQQEEFVKMITRLG